MAVPAIITGPCIRMASVLLITAGMVYLGSMYIGITTGFTALMNRDQNNLVEIYNQLACKKYSTYNSTTKGCDCIKGYRKYLDGLGNTHCLGELGHNCSRDVLCHGFDERNGTMCHPFTGVCVCLQGSYQVGLSCLPDHAFGDNCISDKECGYYGGNSPRCIGAVCRCPADTYFFRRKGECNPCPNGTFFSESSETCEEDINECLQDPRPCPTNVTCTNVAGGFECACPSGSRHVVVANPDTPYGFTSYCIPFTQNIFQLKLLRRGVELEQRSTVSSVVSSLDDCKRKCLKEDKCVLFSYNTATKDCVVSLKPEIKASCHRGPQTVCDIFGLPYTGDVNETVHGEPCVEWTELHHLDFTYKGQHFTVISYRNLSYLTVRYDLSHNFCRKKKDVEGVVCHVFPFMELDTCNVAKCLSACDRRN